jgi:hypothetical protein
MPENRAGGFGQAPLLKAGRLRGPELRLGGLRAVLDYLPPMCMQSLDRITGRPSSPWLPICGKCFQGLGDDPFAGQPGQSRPLAAGNQERCFHCGRRCHPVD